MTPAAAIELWRIDDRPAGLNAAACPPGLAAIRGLLAEQPATWTTLDRMAGPGRSFAVIRSSLDEVKAVAPGLVPRNARSTYVRLADGLGDRI